MLAKVDKNDVDFVILSTDKNTFSATKITKNCFQFDNSTMAEAKKLLNSPLKKFSTAKKQNKLRNNLEFFFVNDTKSE